MVRLRCSFFRAVSKEASLSRRVGGAEAFDDAAFEDAVFEVAVLGEVAPLAAAFSSLLTFATWVAPTDPSQGVASLSRFAEGHLCLSRQTSGHAADPLRPC